MDLVQLQVKAAEEDRVRVEGREPDFENPAGIAGVVLNVVENEPQEFGPGEGEAEEPVEEVVEDKKAKK